MFESLPSFSEITVAQAHRDRGREDVEATEKVPGQQAPHAQKTLRNLLPVQGKRKMPKNRELAAEIRAR